MPSKRAAIDWLKHEVSQGRGNEPCHIVDIVKEQKARIKNEGPKPKTRFQMETDDASLYGQLNFEKDRVIKRVRNKAIAIDLLYRAWRALTDAVIDRIMASEEGPPSL
jgi:hypothetical protein